MRARQATALLALTLAVVVLLTAGAGSSSAAGGGPGTAAYTVTDLRPLVAGLGVPANSVIPTAISPGGLVVGTWDDESFCHTTQSFLFTPTAPNSPTGTMRDIGNFGASAFKATGVNDAGQVTVASENDLQCSAVAHFAFVWQGGALTRLSNDGAANAINALGQAAGNESGAAARWTDAALQQLDDGFSNAFAINNLGHVVGNSNHLPGATANGDAFLWDGTLHDLGRLFDESTALAVNDGDVVAGETSQVNHFSHAFVYSGGEMHDIDCDTRGRVAFGCTGPGTGGSRADGINNAGQVVGEENGRAFLWDSTGGMVDLNTLLPAGSTDVLTNAVGINDSGQIIATGASSSYLLTPPPASSPPAAPELTGPADGAVLASSDVTVTGTGIPGATVHVFVDGVDIGTTLVAADGGISFFFRHTDGTHQLVATQEVNGVTSAATAPRTFTIDTLPPLLTCGTADGMWHGDNVSIACTAVDTGSELANAADGSFALSTSVAAGDETANAATGSRQVCDVAGNCATAGPIGGNMVDRKAPRVTCGSPDGFWHNTNITVGCTASDGGSGVTPTTFGLSTNVAPNTADANSSTNSVAVCDAVGNCVTAGPIGGNMVDLSKPVLQLPANITTTNPVVIFSVNATDPDDIAITVTCNPPAASTFPLGTTTVTCTATDRANNTATGSFTVTVISAKTPLERLTDAVNAIGDANLKAHVRNLPQVGGTGYCSQLKVIASELAAVKPQTATIADALDAVASLQRAGGCSR